MSNIIEELSQYGVVPVVVIDRVEDAKPLGEALVKGGLKCAEVTFRTAAAADAIKIMTDNFPDMLVGAGTVLSTKQVDEAIEAGAKFIVSPGFDPEVVDYCIEKGYPVLPGVATPSEAAQGVKRGLKVLKFFPAEQAGGLAMIKAMAAPYTGIKFMPTGGINEKNMRDYLSYDRIACCGGSWMVKGDLIKSCAFDKIEDMTKEAVKVVKEIRG
ncbi:bifunctional 4-hydroxy-2-oxoglutarate aldolase/2-dehydro-3-deoxy-phosphogluconate aldolase [Butyrivibrio sp. AE3006]|uniref:bifunctional 4-hydroxy-2-oxoglutarate aldolase/2-dehydro-3-deoxy-phosphogluconate aldolase n=1 Tax=Butyrivibrio sp. AE3006 TaxID=1280673 RepID=UPI000402C885|nr:bifunctional 4-hydroxy-2-oxoglutarate aldolase/2-dehydro-3-deoxy-phosphogluconate aldolase [Butyrivibrio sp. AE3006]